jgi:pyruvate kinase
MAAVAVTRPRSGTISSGPELRGGNITLERIMSTSFGTEETHVPKQQTKIVCTLGPACWSVEQLETLIDAGLRVARFNFSHGDHAGHQACWERLQTAIKNKKQYVGTYVHRMEV